MPMVPGSRPRGGPNRYGSSLSDVDTEIGLTSTESAEAISARSVVSAAHDAEH